MRPILFFTAAALFSLLACSDDEFVPADPLNPDQEVFRSNVFVKVIDETSKPVQDVEILLGNARGFTDQKGIFYFHDVSTSHSNYLLAVKEGFLHASRRFYTDDGATKTVTIMLASNEPDGSFNSTSSIIMHFGTLMTIQFPADAYELENGDDYTGTVQVSTFGIPGDDPDLSIKMPGNLEGIADDNSRAVLGSYGMVNVELHSPEGEKLKIKEGYEVQMFFTIPAGMVATAPSTIPMWYFDEANGIWREEGSAVRNGDAYETNVNHFSYWNCDDYFALAPWQGRFHYSDGTSAANLTVCITIDAWQLTACERTDQNGMVAGSLAANENLTLTVKDKLCSSVLFQTSIGPFTTNGDSSDISIPLNQTNLAHVIGQARNCDNNPVENGYLVIDQAGTTQFHSFKDGIIDFYFPSCTTAAISVIAYNTNHNEYSDVLGFPFAQTIDMGTLFACNEDPSSAIFHIEGYADPFVVHHVRASKSEGNVSTYIYDEDLNDGGHYINLHIPSTTMGNYPNTWSETGVRINGQLRLYCGEMAVDVYEYGSLNGYVRANMTGIFTPLDSSGVEYPFTGSFSALRTE